MYGDALKKINTSLGFDPTKPAESGCMGSHATKFRAYAANFAAAGNGMNVKHVHRSVGGKEENSTEVTAKDFCESGVDIKGVYDRKKFEETYSRNMYKEDGNKVDMAATYNYSIADKQWSGNVEAKVSTAEIAEACTAGVRVKFEHKMEGEDKAKSPVSQKLEADVQLTGDKWTFGGKADYDVSKSTLKDAYQQLSYQCSDDVFSW